MNAAAEQMTTQNIMDTPRGQAAKAFVLNTAVRLMVQAGSYRCKACGKRCEVEVEYARGGRSVVHSKGRCNTPGCIAWEE